ncbi:MAG TPA: hypothetical protein VK438_20430 [Xanthobacteraceae bacterium]|nr:hypothetical protein [Xanthobacteraceae bacterium]
MIRRGLLTALALMLPGLALAGDLGRPSPSVFDGLIPKQFLKAPVFPQSTSPITDLEEELRDRSYAMIRPNEPRGDFNLYIAGFQIAHLLPPAFTYRDHTEYARMLLWTPSRSEASLYSRLIEDMQDDRQLIGPLVAVACTVADLDNKREQSLVYVHELSEWETVNAFGRIRENRMLTAWVQRALHWRLESYRYALERFAISIPSVRAVEAEHVLLRFRDAVLAVDAPLIGCAGPEFAAGAPTAAEPLVTK